MLMRRSLGTVDTPSQIPSATVPGQLLFGQSDCSQFGSWLFNPGCWPKSPGEWAYENTVASALGPLPSPPAPPAVSFGLSTEPVPATPSEAFDAQTAAAQAQQAAETAALQSWADQALHNLASVPNCANPNADGTCPTTNYWMWAALGLSALAAAFLVGKF